MNLDSETLIVGRVYIFFVEGTSERCTCTYSTLHPPILLWRYTPLQTYENEGQFYQCDPVPLMELGSVSHKYFLLNLRLPANSTTNVGVGEIKDVQVVVSCLCSPFNPSSSSLIHACCQSAMFIDPLTSGHPPERRLYQSVARYEDAERPWDLRGHIVVLAQNHPHDKAASTPGKVRERVKAIIASSFTSCLFFTFAQERQLIMSCVSYTIWATFYFKSKSKILNLMKI